MNKGGLQSLPKLSFPGGVMAGCEAGFLNGAKIKGNHTAIKSGMLAAETVFEALASGDPGGSALSGMDEKFKASWIFDELHESRNFGPSLHRLGTFLGGGLIWLDQNVFAVSVTFYFT